MKHFDSLSEILSKKNIKPSIQRIKILEYMLGCNAHPTVEQIYDGMRTRMHSLSKATIYNTLRTFEEKGLIRVLSLDNTENRYDIITSDHGHFVCQTCKRITDFEMSFDHIHVEQLDDCKINQKDVFYKGVCQKCLQNK